MSLLETAIGWLAPPDCVGCGVEGVSICVACRELEIIPYGERCFNCGQISPRSQTCPRCRRLGAPVFVWVATDYQGLPKKLIQQYKFNHQRAAHADIADIMAETFYSFNSDEMIQKMDYLLVPVPTASSRVRQRGFDQIRLLNRQLSKKLAMNCSHCLQRSGQSQQVGASRDHRRKQVKGSYFIKHPFEISGRNILLLDDVVTTGATLTEAARTLRKAGAKKVHALVFAKSL